MDWLALHLLEIVLLPGGEEREPVLGADSGDRSKRPDQFRLERLLEERWIVNLEIVQGIAGLRERSGNRESGTRIPHSFSLQGWTNAAGAM